VERTQFATRMTLPSTASTGRTKTTAALVGFLLAVAAAAAFGARFSAASGWYAALKKPSFQPPAWLFAPTWTVLYVLMAVSAWRVWKSPPSKFRRFALGLWAIQLALNAKWSWLFFGEHGARTALVDLCVLLLSVVGYTLAAARTDRPAAWMVVPYVAWLCFAGVLNLEIVLLNS
jgi:translocator protein